MSRRQPTLSAEAGSILLSSLFGVSWPSDGSVVEELLLSDSGACGKAGTIENALASHAFSEGWPRVLTFTSFLILGS